MPIPKTPKVKVPPLSVVNTSTQRTKVGDIGFDPRFDERVKEQQRLNDLTTMVEKRVSQEIPSIYLPDYEGYGFVSSMSDRTAAGGTLTGINDVQLKRPINLRGGQDYMFENPGQVWASAEDPVRAIMMQAAAAKALTGKDPLMMNWRMAPTGGDFAHMTGETMLSFAESNMGKGTKRSLDKEIKQFIPDWKGIDSPDSIAQYRELPDAARKALKAAMDKTFRNEGGLGIGEARLSVADSQQLNAPEGYLMNVGRIFADKPIIEQSGHPSYPKGVPGEGIGRIADDRSLFELNPKVFPPERDIRSLLADPSTARSAYENLPDVVTARSIPNPREPRQSDTRALQMKPYYGILTEDILRGMGYAQGGIVDSAPEEAIKNTIKDPQAFRMLDMDLANLALMSQPQRMAGGGAIHMEHGGITPRAFSYSPTDRDEHNRKLGLPAEFYRAGQADPTMQSYGAGVSVPVEGARLTADAIAFRNAQMRDTLAGIMLGAEFPVGEGTLRAETMRPTMQGATPTYGLRYNQRFANGGQVQRFDGGGEVNVESGIDINREYNPFSVLEKPTYGSDVPSTTPTIDQQRYELTMKGRQEAENRRYRAQQGDALAGVDPTGTLAVADAARTMGLGMAAVPVHAGRVGLHWLQHGNLKDAPTGHDYEETMAPKTEAGSELLSELGSIGSRVTGSEMGFGMHPNLWAHNPPTLAQMRAGLKLGAERAAPVLGKIDQAVRSGYESGAIPQPGMSIKDVTPKILAPANEQGFYSPTEAAALNLQRKSGNGQAFLNDLLKQENVRPDEINAMGLDTWLKDKKNVTAAEVQDYIAQNKLGLGEATYGALTKDISESRDAFKAYSQELASKYNLNPNENISMYARLKNIPAEEIAKYERLQNEWLDQQPKSPKFERWQLPGGENYREVVLTLPTKTVSEAEARAILGAKPDAKLTEADIKFASRKNAEEYRSSHFDEPNILAHLRMSDRVTDGKKTLLIDEVQSDWHQAGRENGYQRKEKITELPNDYFVQELKTIDGHTMYVVRKTDNPSRVVNKDYNRESAINGAINDLNDNPIGVPNAPYKEDWYQLALRRAVKDAIDGGYDRVALPTGARVADRFDLSKQIDSISHQKNPDGTYKVVATDKNGRAALNDASVPKDKLSSIVGKEVAQKIIDAEGKAYPEGSVSEGMKKLSGLDLQVGGEGMKKYYDEIYPGYLKKFGKKYGATIGTTYAKTNINEWPFPIQIESDGKNFWLFGQDPRIDKKAKLSGNFSSYEDANKFRDSMYEGNTEPLHYMDITPAMREAFKTGIHMKKGGKVLFANSLDAMRHELTQRQ